MLYNRSMRTNDKIYIGLGFLFLLYATANYIYSSSEKSLQENPPAPQAQPVKIIAVGDINLGRQTGQKILAGEIDYPFEYIGDYLRSADITFGNLESQLADLGGETQSPTNEYMFAGPPDGAKALANAGFDIVSIANNHMWDYGKDRLFETIDNLDQSNIKYTGANKVPGQLYQPTITEVNGQTIAWFAVTALLNGYEKADATDYVAWADTNKIIPAIQQIRPWVDWIIISMHRGVEYQDNPSETQIDFAHQVIDVGADIVVGHHPHVPQGIETYVAGSSSPSFAPSGSAGATEGEGVKNQRKGVIFYSLGNFAFWQPMDYWTQHSFVAEITLYPGRKFNYTAVPINAGWQPKLTENEEEKNNLVLHLSDLAEKLLLAK